jgi:NSS family neurotransmitter:Na+ symporter
VFVGLPILIGEILLGRTAQRSPVGAYKTLAGSRSTWVGLGWLGVVSAFMLLSFYSVVGGWVLRYLFQSSLDSFSGWTVEQVQSLFNTVYMSAGANLFWVSVFMAITIAVVLKGIQNGLELCSKALMPLLFLILVALLIKGVTLDKFSTAFHFLFSLNTEKLTIQGVQEALGHSFFTLSVGIGAMLTYGSYLPREANVMNNALVIALLDTLVALLACMVVFPITFTYGMPPAQGPGLVFINLPIAFAQMPGGRALTAVFFVCLLFAALTSSINILELAVSYFIDERNWSRQRSTLIAGLAITALALPSALAGGTYLFGTGFQETVGKNWFDLMADTVCNWMLPIGGLGIALFIPWSLAKKLERAPLGITGQRICGVWLWVLKYFVPIAVIAVFTHSIGLV